MGTIDIFRNAAEFISYAPGDVIIREGDTGDTAYAIKDGEVDVMVGGKVVEHLVSGGIFGEMALIDQNPRSATVVATIACQLVPINERQFTFLVQQTPYFALEVMRIMAERLRRLNAANQ
jgi:CRP-like cAMP-binding protein